MADAIGTLAVQSLHPLQTSTGGGSLASLPPGGAAVPDVIAPVLGNIVPADTTDMAPDEALQFDVTDNAGIFYAVFVWVAWVSGVDEIVWDGAAFRPKYSSSSRTAIAGGFRYVVRRNGGWPRLSAELTVEAIDPGGNTL